MAGYCSGAATIAVTMMYEALKGDGGGSGGLYRGVDAEPCRPQVDGDNQALRSC